MESFLLQALGASTGVIGALLMAFKSPHKAWAWPLWVISGIAWILFSLTTQAYGLLIQQIVFTLINVFGVWNWLIRPDNSSDKPHTHQQPVIRD